MRLKACAEWPKMELIARLERARSQMGVGCRRLDVPIGKWQDRQHGSRHPGPSRGLRVADHPTDRSVGGPTDPPGDRADRMLANPSIRPPDRPNDPIRPTARPAARPAGRPAVRPTVRTSNRQRAACSTERSGNRPTGRANGRSTSRPPVQSTSARPTPQSTL